MPVIAVTHPLVRHKIGLLREDGISTKKFRELTHELAGQVWEAELAESELPAAQAAGTVCGIARVDASHFSRRETSSTAEGVGGDPITQVSARFGVESMSGWGAYLFGTNLTDDDGAVDPPYRGQATRLRPRTIGIQVSYRY